MEYVRENGRHPEAPVQRFREHNPQNRRECVSFQSNVPEKVALAYPDGVLKDGMYGPRVRHTLADGRLMWLDPDVAARVNTMEIPPLREFWIVKRKPAGKGQKTRWDIYLEDPTPLPGETPLERDLRLSLHDVERQRETVKVQYDPPAQLLSHSASARPASTPPSPTAPELTLSVSLSKKQPAWTQTLIGQTNNLVDAYAECM